MIGDDDERVYTGFDLVTATVTASDEASVSAPPGEQKEDTQKEDAQAEGLTPEGKEALKAMVALPVEFSAPQMMALARDIAMDILPLPKILLKHNLSNAQYEFLSVHNEFFKHAVVQQTREWQSIASTQERLRAEAAAALEEQLPVLASRMGKQSEKLIDTVEAAKLFAKIAGVDATASGGNASGERFTINIDLGADTRIVVGNGGPKNQGNQPDVDGEIQGVIEGTGNAETLRLVAPRKGSEG